MLLPEAKRRGDIHFLIAKGLRYERRLAIILALLVAGFAIQAFANLFLGAAILLAASLLAAVKGFSNVPELTQSKTEWRQGTREQLQQVIDIARRSRKWDQSVFDITCVRGFLMLLLALLAIFAIAAGLWMIDQPWLAVAWALDVLVLLLPHWVTGVRRILTNDPLVVKIQRLLSVMDAWEAVKEPGESLLPQMQVVSGPQGELPNDAKLVLHVERLGGDFYGLQVQVVLNRVQGRDYPYLYCVLVAKSQSGMLGFLDGASPAEITVEMQQDKEQGLDILVVRQHTIDAGGYSTDEAACCAIFGHALSLCRLVKTPSS